MCYFTTLTFDLGKVESYNAAEVEDKFTQWAKNNTYRKGLKYVFVPEHHKVDKEGRLKIHFHGVINDALTLVDSGTRTLFSSINTHFLQLLNQIRRIYYLWRQYAGT